MKDFDENVSYVIYAYRENRGWKLAHGNLSTIDEAIAGEQVIAQQPDVVRTRVNRIRVETMGERTLSV